MDKQDAKQIVKTLFICLLCFVLSGCLGMAMSSANAAYNHRSLQQKASDYFIVLRINDAVNTDTELNHDSRINVTSFNRIVLLTGQVLTRAQLQRVLEIASQTPNVRHVYNAITIGIPISRATQLHDSWITTKVKSQFIASNDIAPGQIKVVTEDNIVYLMGIVPREEADAAVNIARQSSGVKRVVTIFYYIQMPKLD